MALIKNASTGWSDPVTIQSDEIWQARRGNIYITTSEAPDAEDGLAIVGFGRDGIRLRAGLVVRYRKEGNTAAVIAREVI